MIYKQISKSGSPEASVSTLRDDPRECGLETSQLLKGLKRQGQAKESSQ